MSRRGCTVAGCERLVRIASFGLCFFHYQRLRLNGSVDGGEQAAREAEIRALWGRLVTPEALQPGDCWTWPGSRNRLGYGQTRRNGQRLAHRAAWVHVFGAIPQGMIICHHCDNPPCLRPSHLFIGHHADNVRDKVAKGRHRPAPRQTPSVERGDR